MEFRSHLSKGVKRMVVDGKERAGNTVPDFHDGREHTVEVLLEDGG